MKDIPNYEGLYAITTDGYVWSYGKRRGANHNGKYLRASIDRDGYHRTALKDNYGKAKFFRIGRLMLITYKPTANTSLQANHIDGNRANDRLENLEWVTPSQNILHSFKSLGKTQKGVHNNAFKKWGYEVNGKTIYCFDKSVDDWCRENNIASTTVYTSMRENREMKSGRFKGYKFFRFGSTGQ